MIVTLILMTLIMLLVVLRLKTTNYPPGPFSWPFVGNQFFLRKLTQELGAQHYAFLELCRRYNSDIIALRLGANDTIVVSSNRYIEEVLGRDEFSGRPWNEFVKIRNMGKKKGITMNDGEEWRELRAWSMRTLKNVGFARREMMLLLTDELALILERLKKCGGAQQIRPMIAPAVINVLLSMTTGTRFQDDAKFKYFTTLLERRARAFDMAGGIISSFPWLRYIAPNASGYNILVALNDELRNFLMEIINEHKQRYVEGNESDFIDLFLREMFTQRTKNSVFTDDNLLITLLDFFIAGINNTTVTLDFLFLQMANHQDVQRKVHEEIDRVFGREKIPDLHDRPNMPYTEAVLTECQRIWLVTPIIGPRRTLRDTTLGGYTISKNTTVLLNVFTNNMDSTLYPNPTSFKPERFFKDSVYQPDEKLILFGRGKRRCPGEALAKSAIFLLFVGVMQKYRLLPTPGEKFIKVEITTGLTIAPKPYKMLMVLR